MKYKMKEFLSEKDAKKFEDECLVCMTHEKAHDKIEEGIKCPYCGKLHEPEIDDYVVVGMANYYEPKYLIDKFPKMQCGKCGEHFALMPQKIIYNGNHDIYYTGGEDYLNDDEENEVFELAQKKFEASLKQFIDRYESGEKLDPFYPALWIKRDMTHAIAEYLFKKGLKK